MVEVPFDNVAFGRASQRATGNAIGADALNAQDMIATTGYEALFNIPKYKYKLISTWALATVKPGHCKISLPFEAPKKRRCRRPLKFARHWREIWFASESKRTIKKANHAIRLSLREERFSTPTREMRVIHSIIAVLAA